MEQTARVLSQLGNKDQPSREFQNLVRQIGEAKTKHVSTELDIYLVSRYMYIQITDCGYYNVRGLCRRKIGL